MQNNAAEPPLSQLLTDGRSFFEWQNRPVPEDLLRQLYDLVRLGPTSTNCSPARFLFVTGPKAKARLAPCLWEGNRAKAAAAPVTAIIAWERRFFDRLGFLFPHRPSVAAPMASDPALAEETALRNSSLQGGYFILAARSLGLDCGPMSGFFPRQVDAEFFPEGNWTVNFMVNLGYGNSANQFPRLPRLDFDTACRIL
ncbi:malonic semialdehyde reductase [Neotabrizicola sp. VNH66]|uniref:malonic semialdehyde reductase n=1 Tax=Neotabrizicola sp. VNH66 TaxID=3400918 RepID=UPI003BFD5D30